MSDVSPQPHGSSRSHSDGEVPSSVPDRFRPVVALDIDGVLRLPLIPGEPLPEGAFAAEITLRYEDYPYTFHGAPEWDENGEARDTDVLSGLGAEWVRSLLQRGVEVVWATTWQSFANSVFGPALGLPSLPVAVEGERHGAPTAATWKAWQLAEKYAGRPLVWVDDAPLGAPEFSRLRHPRDRALTHMCPVNPLVGLTSEEVAEVEAWLLLASTKAGQDELRRRRRNARERAQRAMDRRLWGTVANARRRRRILARLQQETRASSVVADIVATYVVRHPETDRGELQTMIEPWLEEGDPDLDRLLAIIEGLE